METFLISTGVVAVSEIGDKTQLLSLLLAARFKRPAPIILGILIATLFNHALAGAVGGLVATALNPTILTWGLGLLFVGMGIWALIPDKLDDEETVKDAATFVGILWITTAAFFLAEMGDKTQLATAALAARLGDVALVVAGTTVGMLLADVPAVYLGRMATEKIQGSWVRYVAAGIFVAMGVFTIAAAPLENLWG
ncbi:MAG: TMEM165/GDT1 family protein [Rhodospirillaceae bacterium]|nr:TMEM165/GDT1 family protein [Rhodospirillaceae bacterium]